MLKSGVSERAHMLKQRLISELSLAELAFCLRQDIATAPVAARAVGALADDPLLEAEGYPGDLLCSLLHAAQSGRLSPALSLKLWDVCSEALAGAEAIRELVVPAASEFLRSQRGGEQES